MKELEALAQFVYDFKLADIDAKILTTTKDCVLDTIGLALGARTNDMFQNIKNVYLAYDGIDPDVVPKKSTLSYLWGSQDRTNLIAAVFLNAMVGHILELDDVHVQSKTHIGTVVIPSAWCLTEYLHKTGKDFLEAVICGYEVMSRIGMGFGVSSHRNKGWHVTCTAGTFGAAAACAKLLGLSAKQILGAFGLAGTQSCATWAFLADGATNKILHPARGAASGLEACLLTLGSMRGSAEILNAKDGGIYPMMSDAYDYSLVSKDLGKKYEILNMDKKPYPCCRSTHCVIDGVLYLKEQHNIDAQDVAKINVKTYLVGLKQCGLTASSKYPTIPTAAKFSTPYTAACALLKGNVGLADFEQKTINEKPLQELLRLVEVFEDKKFTDRYPKHWGCEVEIIMKDGTHYCKEITDASGSVVAPLNHKQILLKVNACCKDYDQNWIKEIFTAIGSLEKAQELPSLLIPKAEVAKLC